MKKERSQNSYTENMSTKFSKHANLLLTTLIVSWTGVALGCAFGYTSPALANIKSNRNPFHLTMEEESWVGSALPIGGLFSFYSSGFMLDKLGRKYALICAIAACAVTWVLVVVSSNFWILLFGRLLTGVFTFIAHVCVFTYLSEIAPSKSRGLIGSSLPLAISAGTFLIYMCGSLLSWTWLAVVPASLLFTSLLMMRFVPETPRWLMINGYKDGALESLQWLRGHEDVASEFQEMQNRLDQPEAKKSGLKEFTKKAIYKPLLLSIAIWFIQVFSGIDFVVFYTVRIFDGTQDFLDPYNQTILVGLSGFVGTFGSFYIMDKFGRKVSLIGSGIVMLICMLLIGVFYHFNHASEVLKHLTWLPFGCLAIYQLSYSLGWGPVPSTMTGEMLPTRVRGVGGGIAMMSMAIFMTVETKFSLTLANSWIHMSGVFWIFAVVLFVGISFVYFCVPETKGKSLEEIEEYFEN